MRKSLTKQECLDIWESKLEELKSTGNVKTSNLLGRKFFSNSYTLEDRISYIEKMIERIKEY